MRVAKLYPIDGGAGWGAPWYDASGRRRVVTAPTVEEAVAKRAKRMAGWTSDEKLGDFLAWWTGEYLPRRVATGRLAEETMDGYTGSWAAPATPVYTDGLPRVLERLRRWHRLLRLRDVFGTDAAAAADRALQACTAALDGYAEQVYRGVGGA